MFYNITNEFEARTHRDKKGTVVGFKKVVSSAIPLMIGVSILAGCSSNRFTSIDPGRMVTGVSVVEVSLSDGRYLDCTDSRLFNDHHTLDCDWVHQRTEPDLGKISAGQFTVFKKLLDDNRVLDCISAGTYQGYSVDTCDWVHAKRLNIS